jgi:N6-adenosine-specific RNA methylase IME4
VNPLPTVDGGFACVLADPPWAFETWGGKHCTPHRGAHDHYGTEVVGDIAEIPLVDVCAADCALFMWIVDSHVPDGVALANAWGFTFKTVAFVWSKARDGFDPVPRMGYWTRKQTEQCWLFTRGSPKRLAKDVAQLIHCPRGSHSAKPDEQYDRIERLVAGPYLELFARSRRDGWSSWGNEVGARDGPLFAEPTP